MPAPLGNTPTRKMPRIEVYGIEDSAATRAAIRFFRDRRIVAQFIDLRKKPLTLTELRRMADRIGLEGLLAAAEAAGDRPAAPEPLGTLVVRIRTDPQLLRLPIVVHDAELTAGPDEPTWKRWLAARSARR